MITVHETDVMSEAEPHLGKTTKQSRSNDKRDSMIILTPVPIPSGNDITTAQKQPDFDQSEINIC